MRETKPRLSSSASFFFERQAVSAYTSLAVFALSRRSGSRAPSLADAYVTTLGIDLAKSVFQLHGVDGDGVVVLRKKLRRGGMLDCLKTLGEITPAAQAAASRHCRHRHRQQDSAHRMGATHKGGKLPRRAGGLNGRKSCGDQWAPQGNARAIVRDDD